MKNLGLFDKATSFVILLVSAVRWPTFFVSLLSPAWQPQIAKNFKWNRKIKSDMSKDTHWMLLSVKNKNFCRGEGVLADNFAHVLTFVPFILLTLVIWSQRKSGASDFLIPRLKCEPAQMWKFRNYHLGRLLLLPFKKPTPPRIFFRLFICQWWTERGGRCFCGQDRSPQLCLVSAQLPSSRTHSCSAAFVVSYGNERGAHLQQD